MTATNGRGGKRPGAGRPVSDADGAYTEARTVTLLPSHWDMLEQRCANVSQALREALDRLAELERAGGDAPGSVKP